MSEIATDPFESLIRRAGQGWLFDAYEPPENATAILREKLHDANAVGRERFGTKAPSLTPEALIDDYSKNPHKVRAFLQVLGTLDTPAILLMVWRVLQGLEIAAIRMSYESEKSFELHVKLFPPDAASHPEEYTSNRIHDAVVLRHFGIMEVDGRGVIDGFFAMNVRP